MRYLKNFNESKIQKGDKEFEIVYTGKEDPNKDGFIIHLTGYDDCIGNKILGFYDFGPYREDILEVPELKKLTTEHENSITTGFIYCNANDVIDFYSMYFCAILLESMSIRPWIEGDYLYQSAISHCLGLLGC